MNHPLAARIFVGGAIAAACAVMAASALSASLWLAAADAASLLLANSAYRVSAGLKRSAGTRSGCLSCIWRPPKRSALAIDAKDQTAPNHIRRVQLYATGLARVLGMSRDEIHAVKTAALLHDIGKLAVPEHILAKPGPLTAEEFQKVRIHPQVGAEIIAAVPFPYPVAPLILSHHERWDGRGYPSGLKEDEIPLGARILCIVDYFDALTSDRPYHKAISVEAALALIKLSRARRRPRLVVPSSTCCLAFAPKPTGSPWTSRSRRRTSRLVKAHGLWAHASSSSATRRRSSKTLRWPTRRSTRSTRLRRPWGRVLACQTRWGSCPRS
jgi:putative nucleotidyltransferase with HDIG domain